MLLTLVLGFASYSFNNSDILLIVGYNYNLSLSMLVLNSRDQHEKWQPNFKRLERNTPLKSYT